MRTIFQTFYQSFSDNYLIERLRLNAQQKKGQEGANKNSVKLDSKNYYEDPFVKSVTFQVQEIINFRR